MAAHLNSAGGPREARAAHAPRYHRAMRAPLPTPPEPAPSRADSKEIVDAVLAAAVELGPDATLTAIAARAGVGVASLHRYFPTTAALFAEISRQTYRTLVLQIREILRDDDRELRSVTRRLCEVAFVGPNLSPAYRRRLNLEIPLAWASDTAAAAYREVFADLTAWLREVLPTPPPDLADRVFMAFATIRGAVLMSLLYPELAPAPATMSTRLTDAIVALLVDPAPTGVAPGVPSSP